jgi:hypothetical protein
MGVFSLNTVHSLDKEVHAIFSRLVLPVFQVELNKLKNMLL